MDNFCQRHNLTYPEGFKCLKCILNPAPIQKHTLIKPETVERELAATRLRIRLGVDSHGLRINE